MLRGHATKREAHAIDELDIDRVGVSAGRLSNTGETCKRGRDGLGTRRGSTAGDDRDTADDFAMAANVAGNDRLLDIGMFTHERGEMLRLGAPSRIKLENARLAREGNSFENALGRLRAEAANLREASVFSCLLEIADIGNLELLVDLVDLLGRETRDLEHVEQAFGRRLTQLVEIARRTCFDEIANDGECCRSEAAHSTDLSGFEQGTEIVCAEGENAARRGQICASLESILTAQLEIGGYLREDVRDSATVHARSVARGALSATAFRALRSTLCPISLRRRRSSSAGQSAHAIASR